ncbi:transposase [Sulfuriroseicoccus oceanibius]|uniref:Transposase IS200-like domain-containing protein n=1 Tax=Sulfuriroseicoccus oceanibius TaxID=2707525 RepID=A0A7T7F1W2_9BACT|nr:transposase [Sulfuriroseicoccus oceanibius]QQL45050.1 hypothetical protein G3M56_000230 [Sulfuriroseicoccus oceanibius]
MSSESDTLVGGVSGGMKAAKKLGSMGAAAREALVAIEAKTAAHVGAGWWGVSEDLEGNVVNLRRPQKRMLGEKGEDACYHVMSRTVGGEVFFDDVEKEALKKLIWKMARFSMVRVVTYAVMGNHFHVLAVVPDAEKALAKFREPGGEELLLKHISCLYSRNAVDEFAQQLKRLGERGQEKARAELIERMLARMCDISRFMNAVKVRFTRWYNKRHERRGTLWMSRFKSVLIGSDEAMRNVALYIELNPVRAGLVDDPVAYRWCGWAEAEVGGSRRARRGICKAVDCPVDSWERGDDRARETYRKLIAYVIERELAARYEEARSAVERGEATREQRLLVRAGRPEVDSEQPGVTKYLLRRTRYFSDSVVIGTKSFVEHAHERYAECFSPRRKTFATKMRDPRGDGRIADEAHYTLKNLVKRVWGSQF